MRRIGPDQSSWDRGGRELGRNRVERAVVSGKAILFNGLKATPLPAIGHEIGLVLDGNVIRVKPLGTVGLDRFNPVPGELVVRKAPIGILAQRTARIRATGTVRDATRL